jgi:hypothetical protein
MEPRGKPKKEERQRPDAWKMRRAQGGRCEGTVAGRTPFLTVVNNQVQRSCTFARVLIILIVHFVLQRINSHLCSQMHSD